VVEFFLGCGLGCFVCVLSAVLVSGCGLASVFAVLGCACMLFTVRMYVGWRVLWMLLKVVFFIVSVTNMWG
jgi:hypothetical protein